MRTGYTHELIEKDQTFQQFALNCARGFGALVMMRDEPMDAPIPEKFQPSNYYSRKLEEYKLEIDRLLAMTDQEKLDFGKASIEKSVKRFQEMLEKDSAENSKLMAMIEKVNAWNPPSQDHVNLKEFMLDQLDISLNDLSWPTNEIKKAEAQDPMQSYNDALEALRRSCDYNRKHHEDEIKRTEGRNTWLKQLRDSLNETNR